MCSTFNMIHKLLHGPRQTNRELLANQQIACFNLRNNVIKFKSGDKYGKYFMAEDYPDVNFGIMLCLIQNMFPMICEIQNTITNYSKGIHDKVTLLHVEIEAIDTSQQFKTRR